MVLLETPTAAQGRTRENSAALLRCPSFGTNKNGVGELKSVCAS
jgi:hypothetical protein